jgi:leader peptidase (prepilin peptidase)/N-methyltransferase
MPLLPPWIPACLFAPFVGSFLGVIVTRHDAMRSALVGRSRCDVCGTMLGAGDLVPLLSWACLRGHCRYCDAKLDFVLPAIELGAFGVAVWSAVAFSDGLFWISCVLGWTLLALAATDVKYFLLPDALTLPLIAGGGLACALLDAGSLVDHCAGAVLGYLLVVVVRFVYRRLRGREGMGLGDAKLLAAAGAWVSWTGLPTVLLVASLSGLVAVAVGSRLGSKGNANVSPTDKVPFGAFLSLGLWIVWLYGPLAAG